MAKFWKKSGGGVFLQLPSSTQFMTDPTNCCCQDPCSVCAAGTTPLEYELVVPSGTLSGTGCSTFEGTFTLSQTAVNPCVWRYFFGDGSYWEVLVTSLYVLVSYAEPPGGTLPAIYFRQSHTFSTSLDCAYSGKSVPWEQNFSGAVCTSSSGKTVTVNAL